MSFLFLFVFIFSFESFAAPPPTNDDPCNAITLSPTPTCNNYQVYSTVGATASTGVPAPGCAGYVGGDIWFKVTVPCATNLYFDTNFGVVMDGGMAIYSGTCGNLTLIDCDDNSSGNGNMPSISLTNLVSGTTIWVRFWSKNNSTAGTFGICVTIPPPPPPGASCPSAGAFCTGSSYEFHSNVNVPDLEGDIYDCLSTTPNPVFYYMQIQDAGNLSIHITQNDAGGNESDVDFCCWGPFPTYASMCPGLSADNVVDCSYSPSGDETCVIPGAQPGEFYMLLLTNFENTPGIIQFEQSGGLASTTCAIICTITAGNTGPVCAGQPFNLTSNIPGGLPGVVYSWTGPNCFGSNLQNPTGVIPPSTPGSYVYTVTATTVDGASCNASTTVVVLNSPGVGAVKTNETCPGLGDGTITVTPPSTGGPFVYTLNPGNVVQNNVPVFTGLAVGTYTISVQPTAGCVGVVSPNPVIGTSSSTPSATAVTANTSCPSASDGTITITPPGAGGPFIYTLNPGNIVHNNNPVYTGLATGTYTITFSNAGGCNGTISPNPVVQAGSALTATATHVNTTCSNLSDGTITVTPPANGGPFVYTLNPGNVVHNNNPVFTGLATGTYTITVTNAAGCIGTVSPSTVIQAGPALTATATHVNTTCPDLNDGTITITPPLTGGPFIYTLNPGNVVHNNNPVYTGLSTGTYTITFTNAAGCNGTISPNQIVTAGSALTATAATIRTSCPVASDGIITITPPVNGAPFIYTLNPGNIVQNNNPVYTGLASGTYTITFTNAVGCSGAVSVNPIVQPGPAITATATHANTTCPDLNDGIITITPPLTGGPFVYTLNPGNIVHNNNPVYTGLSTATYTITFTNAAGCSGTISPNQVVTAGPALTATAATMRTSCPAASDGTITITPPVSGAPFIYTLNPGNIVHNNNPVYTGLASGTYTITFTNSVGCSGAVSVNPIVQPGPVPTTTAVSASTTCPGINDGTITVTAPATGGPFVYTLNPGNIVHNNNPVYQGLASGTYTITFTNALGCSGSVLPNTVVAAGPALSANAPTILNPPCANINDGIVTIIPSAAGVYTYTLNPGLPGQVTQANNPTFTGLAPGNYTYNFTNAAGCIGTGNTTLTTHPPLAITIAKTKPLCFSDANGVITLSASGGLAGYEYALNPFVVYQPNGSFNALTQGNYTFRVRDAAGCIKDTTINLVQPAKLASTAISTAGTCNGNDGNITVTGHDGTSPYTYSLDGITYQPSQSFTVSGGPTPGAAYPNISVKDNNGCVATNTLVYVPLTDNMSALSIGNDTTICVEQKVTFSPQVSAQATVFTWTTFPDPTLSGTLDNTGILNATATPLDTTSYILNAQWGVCSRIDTITINILHKPIPDAGKDTAVCFDKTVAILHGTAGNLSGTVNYEWSDTTNLQTPHSATTVAMPTTTEVFILTVTDNYGCNFSETDRVTVIVQPPVPAYAGHDTIAVIDQPHQLIATGGVSYAWTPSNDLNFSSVQNPLATLSHDQLFQVTVTDVAGCIGYDNVFVQVYPGPSYHIPNAFSPNGDGLNDIFRVVPAGIVYTDWFRIFNRFGELVYESNKWLTGWDGTFKGKKQPIGNYVWILKGFDKNRKVVEMKGTVLLVQ